MTVTDLIRILKTMNPDATVQMTSCVEIPPTTNVGDVLIECDDVYSVEHEPGIAIVQLVTSEFHQRYR
jgi:hypothetical protein